MSSNAGNGGNVTDPASHGGGGGGGQGVVAYSTTQPTLNVTTQVNNGAAGSDNSGGTTNAGTGGGSSGTGTIVASSGPLPIKLVSFDGVIEQNKIKLLWETATEKNNREFIVEKSTNAIDYEIVGTLKGAGNSEDIRHYELYDYTPTYGMNYYRLKQIDFDGTVNIAPIVVVQLNDPGKFVIYPNPLNNNESLYVELLQTQNQALHVLIQDFAGKTLLDKHFDVDQNKIFLINDLVLDKGFYQITIRVGEYSSHTQKLIVR